MLDPRTLAAGIDDEEGPERFASMTPEARLGIFLQLCALTDSVVRGRPDADAIRAATPLSPESEALWLRLMERARDTGR